MRVHKIICVLSGIFVTVALIFQILTLSYKEDISDFLPLDPQRMNALNVYQEISGASRMFAIFQYEDSTCDNPDNIVDAITYFANDLEQRDSCGLVQNLISTIGMEGMQEVAEFVYSNIPYFLSDKDYDDLDSLISLPQFVSERIIQNKQMLMFPVGGLLSDNIGRDPLNIFTPIVSRLQNSTVNIDYQLYDGCIFSPDMSRGIVMLTSPFGSSETENNTLLLNLLNESMASTAAACKGINIHIIGAPVIAVGNAEQIKSDSFLSIGISVVLILLLLYFAFRRLKNIFCIFVSIAWGLLFAIGGLSLVHNNVSVIVIGISSVIIGIAVNYPLHLIAHLNHTPNVRDAIKEIVKPLVIGNITTVGAFLALVPLKSVALRDLGLFSSFLLIGTIIFVLLYLPHVVKSCGKDSQLFIIDKLGEINPENKPWLMWSVAIVTIVLCYFSLQTSFDSNMSHINFMTEGQKEDMAYFQKMVTNTSSDETLYVISHSESLDSALKANHRLQPYFDDLTNAGKIAKRKSCSGFITSSEDQAHRLSRWHDFVAKNAESLKIAIENESAKVGFAENSFEEFYTLLQTDFTLKSFEYFAPLTKTVFSGNICADSISGLYSVVDVLSVPKHLLHDVESTINTEHTECFCFDLYSLNSTIADSLSEDFNYIGFVCGGLVFFFLWFSFGRIELALLSFLPMAVSWIWILGIMGLLNIQFNIVNIILATFIFGQGDDYTIFMTEGACYEYAYRKKVLASYKHSIIISALIMFIGIGSLIVAKHPALHSLAEVTIIGMSSVVFMAYTIPPLVFKWLVYDSNGNTRVRPITLRSLFTAGYCSLGFFIELALMLMAGFFMFVITKPTAHKRMQFHKAVFKLFSMNMNGFWGVRFNIENKHKWDFSSPRLVVCNHQSMLDSACIMALSPRLIILSNKKVSSNPVISQIFKWLDFQTLQSSKNLNIDKLQSLIHEGYSIVVFPEGERNAKSSILRFHKGAFLLSEHLKLDILPVFLHGINDVMPRNSLCVYPGTLNLIIEDTFKTTNLSYQEVTKTIHKYYCQRYAEIKHTNETYQYYTNLLLDRYRYKGNDIEKQAKNALKNIDAFSAMMQSTQCDNVIVLNAGIGSLCILYALVHPNVHIIAYETDEGKRNVAKYAASGIADNIEFVEPSMFEIHKANNSTIFDLYDL